jgi:hypothetical protein
MILVTTQTSAPRPRKAAYSVAETAAMCGISRSRFYDYIESGIVPPPCYLLRTRRPYYPADLAALCVRVRETSVGFDGHFVMFYDRRPKSRTPVPATGQSRNDRKTAATDPLTQEMVETLRAMGVRAGEVEMVDVIRTLCPAGVAETTFETDLRAIFDALRCREAV